MREPRTPFEHAWLNAWAVHGGWVRAQREHEAARSRNAAHHMTLATALAYGRALDQFVLGGFGS